MLFRYFCMLVACLLPTQLWAGAIQIESEKMTVFHKLNQVEFTGNVHLTRDEFELHCDRLLGYYNEQELERVEAFDNIRLKHGKISGTSNKAVLNQAKDTLTLSGNAVLEQDGSRVEGEEIVHNMKLERTVVTPVKGGRTHMTIESDEGGSDILPNMGSGQ